MLISSALAATLLMSVQATPADAAPETTAEVTQNTLDDAEETAAREETADEDKIICRRTAVVGSRFKKRICGTQEQWLTLRGESKKATADMQRRGRGMEPDRN